MGKLVLSLLITISLFVFEVSCNVAQSNAIFSQFDQFDQFDQFNQFNQFNQPSPPSLTQGSKNNVWQSNTYLPDFDPFKQKIPSASLCQNSPVSKIDQQAQLEVQSYFVSQNITKQVLLLTCVSKKDQFKFGYSFQIQYYLLIYASEKGIVEIPMMGNDLDKSCRVINASIISTAGSQQMQKSIR